MHSKSDFERPVRRWQDIPGWFQWRGAQVDAVAHFGDGSRFVEVGCYLGKSLCSLAELIRESGRGIALTGVDTARGSGPEGTHDTNAHGPAVEYGGGTFAGLLHRNVIACGAADLVQLVISDSVTAANLFPDQSLDVGAHRRATRLRQRVGRHRGMGAEDTHGRLAVRRRLQRRSVAGCRRGRA